MVEFFQRIGNSKANKFVFIKILTGRTHVKFNIYKQLNTLKTQRTTQVIKKNTKSRGKNGQKKKQANPIKQII